MEDGAREDELVSSFYKGKKWDDPEVIPPLAKIKRAAGFNPRPFFKGD
jgi:hypothetical protein